MATNRSQRLKDLRDQFPREISAEDVMDELKLERREAVNLLKEADKRGLGRFVLGRGSNKTRIVWKAAQYSPMEDVIPDTTLSQMGNSRASLEHTFPLNEFNVEIRLPRDLTSSEAERIARFVASLATNNT